MKKILAALLILASLVFTFACSDSEQYYEPVESTEEEKRVVMTFFLDGKSYDVKYELYRSLFLNFSEQYDNGDKSFWDSEASADALNEINEKIISFAADIYSTLHLSQRIGFDPYSSDVDTQIKDYIKKSVDGYADEDESFIGFGGDYNAYLLHLKSLNINYSVQELLIRYEIARSAITMHYTGTIDSENPSEDMEGGALQYSEADVKSFYDSDSCVRVLLTELDSKSFSSSRAEEIREKISSFSDTQDVKNYIVSFTATTESDAFSGVLIGSNSLDSAYYSEMKKAAFALSYMQTSEVIPVVTDRGSYYYILYKVDKNDEHYYENYSDVLNVYIRNEIGKIFSSVKSEFSNAITYTEIFNTIKHSEISMS